MGRYDHQYCYYTVIWIQPLLPYHCGSFFSCEALFAVAWWFNQFVTMLNTIIQFKYGSNGLVILPLALARTVRFALLFACVFNNETLLFILESDAAFARAKKK